MLEEKNLDLLGEKRQGPSVIIHEGIQIGLWGGEKIQKT